MSTDNKTTMPVIDRQLSNIRQLKPFHYYSVQAHIGEQLVASVIRMLVNMGITTKERYDLPTPRGILIDGTPVSVYYVKVINPKSEPMCECVTSVGENFYVLWYEYIYILNGKEFNNTQLLQFSNTDLLQSLYETVRLEYNRRRRK